MFFLLGTAVRFPSEHCVGGEWTGLMLMTSRGKLLKPNVKCATLTFGPPRFSFPD